jgi:hypothetical protein
MILLFVISCIILSLIILTIFVFLTIKYDKKYTIVNYIDHCKYPSIIGYTNNGIYTNIIKNKNDKILISFLSDKNLNVSFLSPTTFQIIDKSNISTLINDFSLSPCLIIGLNYNLSLSCDFFIISLLSKITYNFNYPLSAFFKFDNDFYTITSFSPLIIHKINNDFHILDLIFNINWFDNDIRINSNPILINGFFWIIGTYDNFLIFLIFDFLNKKIINFYKFDIFFHISYGLLYNSYNDTFIIPIIKNNKIQIFNINKNDILSNTSSLT